MINGATEKSTIFLYKTQMLTTKFKNFCKGWQSEVRYKVGAESQEIITKIKSAQSFLFTSPMVSCSKHQKTLLHNWFIEFNIISNWVSYFDWINFSYSFKKITLLRSGK